MPVHLFPRHAIMGWPRRSPLSLALLGVLFSLPATAAAASAEHSDDTIFDTQIMRVRGVDPRLGEWFRQAPRFLPGETTVALTVNGRARGRVPVRFDQDGQLCADKNFQKQAGLISPPGYGGDDAAACFDLKTAWPQTELHLDPGEERVDLVVPPQAVAAPGTESGNWHHGGTAGMLNYTARYMDSAGATAGVSFMQLDTEAGFNAGDWIVRSHQTFSRFNGEDNLRYQSAYAQRSFTDSRQVLQAGQVSLRNSLFGTGQVLGFQVFPETALRGSRGGAGLVEGVADSQSVVEVRQSGALVYSTTVPAGPFRLQGFSLLNTRSDLEVTLTGSNGEERRFTVPASTFPLRGAAVAPGLSYGVGRLDQDGSSESPVLGTLANGWVLDPYTTLNAGVLGATSYRAGAMSLNTQLFDDTFLSLQTRLAEDAKHGNRGMSATATLKHDLTERVGVGVNASQQTSGYRELSDALQEDSQDTQDRSRNQVGVRANWAAQDLGSLTLSWSRSSTFNGGSYQTLRGGWSKRFGRASVSASLQHATGTRTTDADNRMYLRVSIPLGGRSVSSYINSTDRGTRAGVSYSDHTRRDRGWGLSSERDFESNRTLLSGQVNRVTPVSQLSGNLSHNSDNYTSWSASAIGAVVAYGNGIVLSPNHVGDTFGIARVGEEAGVQLDTPAGPTWTNGSGYAVLPSLNGFKRSTIQVDTRTLAKNVDIGNAWQETEAARGSVSHVDFDVVRTRRVLVDAKDAEGNPLPYGAGVFDADGNFVTVVGRRGAVFVPDASPGMALEVQASGKTLCTLTLDIPEDADLSQLYETATAQCDGEETS